MIEEDFVVFSDMLKEKYGFIYGPIYRAQSIIRFLIPLNKNLEEDGMPIREPYFSINFNLTNKHIYINLKKTNGELLRLYSFRSIGVWPEIRFTQTPTEF